MKIKATVAIHQPVGNTCEGCIGAGVAFLSVAMETMLYTYDDSMRVELQSEQIPNWFKFVSSLDK